MSSQLRSSSPGVLQRRYAPRESGYRQRTLTLHTSSTVQKLLPLRSIIHIRLTDLLYNRAHKSVPPHNSRKDIAHARKRGHIRLRFTRKAQSTLRADLQHSFKSLIKVPRIQPFVSQSLQREAEEAPREEGHLDISLAKLNVQAKKEVL